MKIFSVEQFEDWVQERHEPSWLVEARRKSLQTYHELDYPDRFSEAWRRLPWDKIPFETLTPAQKVAEPIIENQEALAEQGILIAPLSRAIHLYPDQLRRYWGKSFESETKFSSLALAFANTGVFLYLPKSVEVAEPIRISWKSSLSGESIFPYLLIVAEQNSHVEIIEEIASETGSEKGLVYGVREVVAKQDATVDFVSVQDYAQNVDSIFTNRSLVERNANVQTAYLGLGGKVSHGSYETNLVGNGASADLLGLFYGNKGQQFNANTLQYHRSPQAYSNLLFKSALKDQAYSSYYGVINVEKEAQQTDAYQANRNLLLSKGTKADTVPVLEIEADDVRCTHGATVGPVDEEQKFYLMCRGLGKEAAEQLLLHGFFEHGIQTIRKEPLRKLVWDRLAQKIGQGERALLTEEILLAEVT